MALARRQRDYQSFRNTSDDGLFVSFQGDRIPNRPWFFANAALRVRRRAALVAGDELALISYARYVHEFLRGWESIGVAEAGPRTRSRSSASCC